MTSSWPLFETHLCSWVYACANFDCFLIKIKAKSYYEKIPWTKSIGFWSKKERKTRASLLVCKQCTGLFHLFSFSNTSYLHVFCKLLCVFEILVHEIWLTGRNIQKLMTFSCNGVIMTSFQIVWKCTSKRKSRKTFIFN